MSKFIILFLICQLLTVSFSIESAIAIEQPDLYEQDEERDITYEADIPEDKPVSPTPGKLPISPAAPISDLTKVKLDLKRVEQSIHTFEMKDGKLTFEGGDSSISFKGNGVVTPGKLSIKDGLVPPSVVLDLLISGRPFLVTDEIGVNINKVFPVQGKSIPFLGNIAIAPICTPEFKCEMKVCTKDKTFSGSVLASGSVSGTGHATAFIDQNIPLPLPRERKITNADFNFGGSVSYGISGTFSGSSQEFNIDLNVTMNVGLSVSGVVRYAALVPQATHVRMPGRPIANLKGRIHDRVNPEMVWVEQPLITGDVSETVTIVDFVRIKVKKNGEGYDYSIYTKDKDLINSSNLNSNFFFHGIFQDRYKGMLGRFFQKIDGKIGSVVTEKLYGAVAKSEGLFLTTLEKEYVKRKNDLLNQAVPTIYDFMKMIECVKPDPVELANFLNALKVKGKPTLPVRTPEIIPVTHVEPVTHPPVDKVQCQFNEVKATDGSFICNIIKNNTVISRYGSRCSSDMPDIFKQEIVRNCGSLPF